VLRPRVLGGAGWRLLAAGHVFTLYYLGTSGEEIVALISCWQVAVVCGRFHLVMTVIGSTFMRSTTGAAGCTPCVSPDPVFHIPYFHSV